MLGEHISWIGDVRTFQNKIVKNIGLFYRLSQFVNEDFLKTIYFPYIHSHLNCVNIVWVTTSAMKLKRVYLKQKLAVRILFNKDKPTHSKPLFETFNALNVYQINIHQHLNFMHKFIKNQISSIIGDFIKKPDHKYPINF